jgi:hypothetical protein
MQGSGGAIQTPVLLFQQTPLAEIKEAILASFWDRHIKAFFY